MHVAIAEAGTTPIAPQADVDAQKELFAIAWLQYPDDPFKAGLAVFPGEAGLAMNAAQSWVMDPVVLAKKAAVITEVGEESFLPTKVDLARAVWDLARNDKCANEEKIKAYKLYGEIRGFIQGPNSKVQHNLSIDLGEIVNKMDAAFAKSRKDRGVIDAKEVLPLTKQAVANG